MNLSTEQISKVLRLAADLIERDGWCRGEQARDAAGKPCSPHGPEVAGRCAYGAIVAAAWRIPTATPEDDREFVDPRDVADLAYESVRSEVARRGDENFIGDWNDAPERTAEDVTLLLRRVAAKTIG